MSSEALGPRLLRELERNKAKSAALAVLCLVAVWFWAPLIKKYTIGDSKAAATATSTAAPTPSTADAAAVPTPTGETAPPGGKMEFDWQTFVAWKEQEIRMAPSPVHELVPDPFLPIPADEPLAQAGNQPGAAAAALPKTPQELGLTLRSTLISSRGSMANINGEHYGIGGEIPAATTGGGDELGFRLVEITRQYVVVDRAGETYRLELNPQPASSGRVTIRPVSGGSAAVTP